MLTLHFLWQGVPDHSEEDFNECGSAPCQHGGLCYESKMGYSVKIGGYYCHTAPGYSGSDGDKDVNECASSPCQNGGTCVDS